MELQSSPEHEDYVKCQEKRLRLRESMQSAIKGYAFIQDVLSDKISKVSSINKFTSKLKTDNRNIEQLITEMQTLNISKFLDEVAIIIASSVTTSEVKQLAQLACKIGTYYQTFPTSLIKQLKKQIDNILTQDDKTQLLALFHLVIELFVYGFPLLQNDIPELIKKVFKAGINPKEAFQMDQNKKQKNYAFNIDFYWVLARQFGEVFCGLTSRRMELWTKEGRQLIKFPEMITVQIKKSISSFLQKYIKQVSVVLEESMKNLAKIQDSLRQQLKLNGKFSPQTEKSYNQFIERYQKTKSRLMQIGQYTSTQISYSGMDDKILGIEDISKQQYSIAENGQIFEDDYQKELYVNLITISEENPKTQQNDKTYQDFKSNLDTCKTVQDADKVVQLFLPINNKKTRKQLVRDLLEYRRQYQLMTPFMCRIAATLSKKWKDVEEIINQMLFNEYDKLKDFTEANFITIDKRTRNHKYICELTKFRLIDCDKTMTCMKALVDDLVGPNIDLLLMCLESVGRYLYLTKQSTPKFVFLLTQLNNVMKKKPLPVMIESRINNSIALLKPMEPVMKKQKPPKSETEIQLKQILNLISKDNIDTSMDSIRKIMQENVQAETLFIKRLMKSVPKHQFIENYFLAVILDKLENQSLYVKVRQQIEERIISLIDNEESQQLLSWARFFGQLLNYQLISRDDFYRFAKKLLRIQENSIRVINTLCTTLNSCSESLVSKKVSNINQKLKLLLDFKMYINTRAYIPMFIEFEILDLLERIQPEIIPMGNDEITKFKTLMEQKQHGRQKQLNELRELQNFVMTKKKPLYKEKVQQQEYDRKQEETREKPEIKQTKIEHDMDDQFDTYMKQEVEKSMGRIAKPKIAEAVLPTKKKTNEKSIVILGKSGTKIIRKQINIKL